MRTIEINILEVGDEVYFSTQPASVMLAPANAWIVMHASDRGADGCQVITVVPVDRVTGGEIRSDPVSGESPERVAHVRYIRRWMGDRHEVEEHK